MFNLKPIALVGGTVVCSVGFLLFIPLAIEIIYQTELVLSLFSHKSVIDWSILAKFHLS